MGLHPMDGGEGFGWHPSTPLLRQSNGVRASGQTCLMVLLHNRLGRALRLDVSLLQPHRPAAEAAHRSHVVADQQDSRATVAKAAHPCLAFVLEGFVPD